MGERDKRLAQHSTEDRAMRSICLKCGWQSKPFPRGHIDTYDHFCEKCGEPIRRWHQVPSTEEQGREVP